MPLIKLDAIGSTNDFLKELLRTQTVANFTVVSADTQFSGKGQRGAVWQSEPGKNLIMSVLFRGVAKDASQLFALNALVATTVVRVLQKHAIAQLHVKWPNDILSGNRKIGGILIENSMGDSIDSIVGIGINVNQTNFDGLPQASSLAVVSGKTFDKDALVQEMASALEAACQNPNWETIWQGYQSQLYKRDVPSAFESAAGEKFMGIIRRVSEQGLLEVEREDAQLALFDIKEIKMLY